MDEIPFLQARHYRPAGRKSVDWVVIHTAEVGEWGDSAEKLMQRCAVTDRVVSWHFAVDSNSITQSVREHDIAFHAPGANRTGIGVELCGRAAQTAAQWGDKYSMAMLARSARLIAEICKRWHIPVSYVSTEGLLGKHRGITTHAAASKAFGGTHTDPGPGFPMAKFLDSVRAARNDLA